MSNNRPVTITVLRHGEVKGRAHVFRGVSDEMLSAHGHTQMQQVLSRAGPFDVVATSPLRRCHEFAHDYAKRHGTGLQVMPCFGELNFGTWEGLTPAEAAARDPAAYHAFQSTHGMHAPPDGESLAAFRARIAQGWQMWMNEDCGHNRLLVTHAGVIRALLMELFALAPEQAFQFALPEAACMRISHLDGQRPFLLSLN